MSAPAAAPTPGDVDDEANPALRQRPRSSLSSFLFLSFVFFMMTNNSTGDDAEVRSRYTRTLTSLEWQYGNYTAWLNGTTTANFTMPAHLPEESRLRGEVLEHGEILDPSYQAYYPNITGFIRGPSSVYNITPGVLSDVEYPWLSDAHTLMAGVNLTEAVDKLGSWNWTAVEKVALSVVEKPMRADERNRRQQEEEKDIVSIQGHIELIDVNTEEEMRVEFSGVHFLKNGSIFGFAEPVGSVIDIRTLPSLVPPPAQNETAHALLPALKSRIDQLKSTLDNADLSTDSSIISAPDTPTSACRFHVYAQVTPANVSEAQMVELEEELAKPTGARTVRRPPLLVNAVLLSQECGLLVKVKEAEGLRSKLFFRKVTTYAGFAGVVYLVLLVLLSRQMGESRTPAALARISRWTFLAQVVADSIAFAGHITFAILAEGRPSIALVAPAFLSCALFAYEIQFAMIIYQVQAPEDSVLPPPPAPSPTPMAVPVPPAPAPAPTPVLEPDHAHDATASDPLLGIPAQERPSAPQAAPSPAPTPVQPQPRLRFLRVFWTHLRDDPQARTWALISIILFVVMRIILAPSLAMACFAVLYGSIWMPQIVRAARRGRTCALSAEYMVGTTLGRLAVGMYFLACPKNVLDVTPRGWIYPLALMMFAQMGFIWLQNTVGPSFFLPQRYSETSSYDYHPPLPRGTDIEAPDASLGDCAICMDAIRYDEKERAAQGADEKREVVVGGLLGRFGVGVSVATAGKRKNYSLSPCHHLFHTECLERWLAIKNICPQCRRPLPPL